MINDNRTAADRARRRDLADAAAGDTLAIHAYIYDRHSTPSQGILLLRLEACREHAALQGWTVAGEWIDRGDHALADAQTRPEFGDMLRAMTQAAADGQTVVCIVNDWDRLSLTPGASGILRRRVGHAGGWTETAVGESDRHDQARLRNLRTSATTS